MKVYIVDTVPDNNGVHAIHLNDGSCPYEPPLTREQTIGRFADGRSAVAAARIRNYSWWIEPCPYCCPDVDTRYRFDYEPPRRMWQRGT